MSKKKINTSHVDRLAKKMRGDDCETATYATQIFTSLSQQKQARKPRPSTLQKLIIECLTTNANAKSKDVIKYLKGKCGEGIIESIIGETIEWTSSTGKAETTEISSLDDRIYRARKIINSSR